VNLVSVGSSGAVRICADILPQSLHHLPRLKDAGGEHRKSGHNVCIAMAQKQLHPHDDGPWQHNIGIYQSC
jgi:hypothetical protein